MTSYSSKVSDLTYLEIFLRKIQIINPALHIKVDCVFHLPKSVWAT